MRRPNVKNDKNDTSSAYRRHARARVNGDRGWKCHFCHSQHPRTSIPRKPRPAVLRCGRNPRLSRPCRNRLRVPAYSPARSVHSFHDWNKVLPAAQPSSRRSQHSSIQVPIASSASRSESVASRTAFGGASRRCCHSRQPQIIHHRMPGHSALSLSPRSQSRSAWRYCHHERQQVKAAPDCLVDRSQVRLVVAGNPQLELRHKLEKILTHEAGANSITAGQRIDLASAQRRPSSV